MPSERETLDQLRKMKRLKELEARENIDPGFGPKPDGSMRSLSELDLGAAIKNELTKKPSPFIQSILDNPLFGAGSPAAGGILRTTLKGAGRHLGKGAVETAKAAGTIAKELPSVQIGKAILRKAAKKQVSQASKSVAKKTIKETTKKAAKKTATKTAKKTIKKKSTALSRRINKKDKKAIEAGIKAVEKHRASLKKAGLQKGTPKAFKPKRLSKKELADSKAVQKFRESLKKAGLQK